MVESALRAEVLGVNQNDGRTVATLRYEPMCDYDSQIGEVRLFPSHVQILNEGEPTQLKWRFYESSGAVSYGVSGTMDDETVIKSDEFQDNELCNALRGTIGELNQRVEHIERVLTFKKEITGRITASERLKPPSDGEPTEQLLALLRYKLAIVAQKPVSSFKHRNTDHENSKAVFDFSYASTMQASVDCSADDLELLCRFIHRSVPNVQSKVDGRTFKPSFGSLVAGINSAEIVFESLVGFCRALGINATTDIMNLARRGKGNGRTGSSKDAAIRICGCFLVDSKGHDTPSAILVCRSLHDGMSLDENIEVIIRDRRVLDQRTMGYEEVLRKQTTTIAELTKRIYGDNHQVNTLSGCRRQIANLSSEVDSLSLAWRAFPTPNGKFRTRKMITGNRAVGSLKVKVTYLLIRGNMAVQEVLDATEDEDVMRQIETAELPSSA